MEINNKKILILGASSDMARATALQLSEKGASLILAGRNQKKIEADAADLAIRSGKDVRSVVFDSLKESTHKKFFAGQDFDIVISFIGLLGDQAISQADPKEARRIIDTNFTSVICALEVAAEILEEKGTGMIVGISSVAGDRGRASNYIYGSAKAGFSAFLSGLRNRLAKKSIHVLTVKPGFVRTSMTAGMDLPNALTGEPEAVARDIIRGIEKEKNVLYTRWMWRYIMLIIRSIPEGIFKKLSL